MTEGRERHRDTLDPLTALGYTRPDWQRDALCREYPQLAWFPERGQSAGPALQVCGRCTVMLECRHWAITEHIDHGVLGGMTARTRIAARRLATKRAPQ